MSPKSNRNTRLLPYVLCRDLAHQYMYIDIGSKHIPNSSVDSSSSQALRVWWSVCRPLYRPLAFFGARALQWLLGSSRNYEYEPLPTNNPALLKRRAHKPVDRLTHLPCSWTLHVGFHSYYIYPLPVRGCYVICLTALCLMWEVASAINDAQHVVWTQHGCLGTMPNPKGYTRHIWFNISERSCARAEEPWVGKPPWSDWL